MESYVERFARERREQAQKETRRNSGKGKRVRKETHNGEETRRKEETQDGKDTRSEGQATQAESSAGE